MALPPWECKSVWARARNRPRRIDGSQPYPSVVAELRADRSLRLPPKGRTLAVSIVRRHRLAERLLTDVIGLEWEKVHREADRWEQAISADVEEKLVALLVDPATGRGRPPRRAWAPAASARRWSSTTTRCSCSSPPGWYPRARPSSWRTTP